MLKAAAAASPLDYAYPVATWTAADLADLPRRRVWGARPATVSRAPRGLGHRYPRLGTT